MFFANYLKLCNKINKSPSAVAEEIGFQRSVVTRWGDGTNPRRATLQKIADYFGISVEELIKNPEEEQKEKSPDQKAGELTQEKLKELLYSMSVADLADLMSDCAEEMKRRGQNGQIDE